MLRVKRKASGPSREADAGVTSRASVLSMALAALLSCAVAACSVDGEVSQTGSGSEDAPEHADDDSTGGVAAGDASGDVEASVDSDVDDDVARDVSDDADDSSDGVYMSVGDADTVANDAGAVEDDAGMMAQEVSCQVGSMTGACESSTRPCGAAEAGIAGYCEGATLCCVDAGGDPNIGVACDVAGVAGACLHVEDCDGDRRSTSGLCPGPAEVQCCTPTQGLACDPEQPPFPNEGVLVEAPGEGGCPDGMLRVDAAQPFCVDRYEASLIEVLADGSERSWTPYQTPGSLRVRAVSVAGVVPQAHISGTQAAAACAEAGKRLCSSDEWLRVCQGPDGWTYPYGQTRQWGVCNDSRANHPVVEYFGTSDPWIWSELNNACINQLPDSLALTGAHAGCVTSEGALDVMGNLHEWVSDSSGIFRGGFYVDTVINGEGCLYRTTAHSVGHYDYSTGFRCCSDL